jgi:16S rRNA (guanine527-N7)-methyltransferase
MGEMPPARWDPYGRLSSGQREQLAEYGRLLLEFNRRLNLISREDEAEVEEHHIRHSLILTLKEFPAGAAVVDWGTGGGLPAIPLAICFPTARIYAVDSVEKKIRAVEAMGRRLGLANLFPWHGRAEAWPKPTQFSVSRATAPLVTLWSWHRRAVAAGADVSLDVATAGSARGLTSAASAGMGDQASAGQWKRGLICLKGGELQPEIDALLAAYPSLMVDRHPIQAVYRRPYFANKMVLEIWE